MGWRNLSKARKTAIVCGIVFGVPCLMPGVATLYVHFRATGIASDLHREEAALRKMGVPITRAELEHGTDSAGSNAATVYARLHAAHQQATGRQPQVLIDAEKASSNIERASGTKEDIPPLREYVLQLEPVWPLVEAAVKLDRCNFGKIPSPEPDFTYESEAVQGARNAFDMLVDRALLEWKTAEYASAIGTLAKASRVACHLMQCRSFWRYVEGAKMDRSALLLMARVLEDSWQRPGIRQALADAMRGLPQLPSVRLALYGDLVLERELLHDMESLIGALSENPKDTAPGPEGAIDRSFARDQAVRDAYDTLLMRAYRKMFEAMPADEQDTVALAASFPKDLESGGFWRDAEQFFNMVWLPPENGANPVLLSTAYRRVLRTVSFMLDEWSKTGHLPTVLPSTGRDSLDPYDGSPLRLSPRPGGFVLYSVGEDRTDDGGQVDTPPRRPKDAGVRIVSRP